MCKDIVNLVMNDITRSSADILPYFQSVYLHECRTRDVNVH